MQKTGTVWNISKFDLAWVCNTKDYPTFAALCPAAAELFLSV